jgi:hypothetical protein
LWFDGLGTFKFHDTADLGGFVIQRGTADNPIVGTYTVNPDGTGTMQWFSNGSNHTPARNFPRNARPNFTEYLSERPEMSSQ